MDQFHTPAMSRDIFHGFSKAAASWTKGMNNGEGSLHIFASLAQYVYVHTHVYIHTIYTCVRVYM